MRWIVWSVLVCSFLILVLVLMRNRESRQLLMKAGLAVAAAALLLYATNWFGASYDFHIPINGGTVALVGLLGLPGLALLAAVQWVVL
ncbi:pro-sigmaK processing inhibitor BofA family protein [Gorillibacterium sp. CAU 1737]|uniref:pro-sigmaK processing inhibitor BofA family protein n=1 Tax=Gorillibacterium sp. CAU 1737 TaxID=3140362 RepID=UPI003261544A